MIDYENILKLNEISDSVVTALATFYQTSEEEIRIRLSKMKGYVYTPIEAVDEFIYHQENVWATYYILKFLKENGVEVKQDVFQSDLAKKSVVYLGHSKCLERYTTDEESARKLILEVQNRSINDSNVTKSYHSILKEYENSMMIYKEDLKKIEQYKKKNSHIYHKFVSKCYKKIVKQYPTHPITDLFHMEYTNKKYWVEEEIESKIDPFHIVNAMIQGFFHEPDYFSDYREKRNLWRNRLYYLNTVYHLNIQTETELETNPLFLAYYPSKEMVTELKRLQKQYYDTYQLQLFCIDPYITPFKEYIITGLKNKMINLRVIQSLFLNPNVEGFSDASEKDTLSFFVKPLGTNNPSIIAFHEFLHEIETTYYYDDLGNIHDKCGISIDQKNDKMKTNHYYILNEIFHQLTVEDFYQSLLENKIELFGNLFYQDKIQKNSYHNFYHLVKPIYQEYQEEIHFVKFHDIYSMKHLLSEIGMQNYYDMNDILNECYLENNLDFDRMKEKRKQYYLKNMRNVQKRIKTEKK